MHPTPTPPPVSGRRFLPAVVEGFALGGHEPLATGLRRMAVDQFDAALSVIATETVDVAIHEVRKVTKRLRAVLRLVRSELGDKRYRIENAILRDTARMLAPLRDTDVRVASVGAVRDRFEPQLRASAFEGVEKRLADRRRRVLDQMVDGDEWRKVAYALRSARARYAAWPVDDETARAHGMAVIPHRFASVERGLGQTYARGRQEMGEAGRHRTAVNFHSWRKRARYLRHQVEMLSPVFPDVLEGYASALTRLGDLLGDEHDLADLLRFLAGHPEYCPDPIERSMLVALVQHRRAELQAAALSLGSRVYAESPDRFTRRVRDYWDAWDDPLPVGFAP
ncbi:MAG TPA: CHAD domain-containing protein [Acidimicrobiia bacterium]|nr:CHAD domain-containing protein [Acidimicrobiia bacterium]